MLKKIVFALALLLLLTSCSSDYDKRLKISATTWIGYSPLFYAKEKGWLKPLNIKLINISSLAENMYLYKAGNSDAYTGTQYEYNILSQDIKTLKPIMMFDRSNGGDVVMGNVSIEELQNSTVEIDAYLEIDSINNIVLEDFISEYNLKDKKINYINKDQSQIKLLRSNTKPTLIVTYVPYNITLKKNGFKELASTKENLKLLVVDALFTKIEMFDEHKQQFVELKKLLDRGVEALEKNPQEFYETIKPYMLNVSYKEFQEIINDIEWINKNLSDELKKRMNKTNFPTRDLI